MKRRSEAVEDTIAEVLRKTTRPLGAGFRLLPENHASVQALLTRLDAPPSPWTVERWRRSRRDKKPD